ncbi:MAG: chorismate-binding protein, partial [Lentisphaeria bacterium]|nr:chorismate-binding protein [Lentisphaeria bacterium]
MFYPSREEFQELSSQGNLIPVYCELNADSETVISTFKKLAFRNGKQLDHSFLLESIEGGTQLSRYSFMGCDPRSIITHNNNTGTFIVEGGQSTKLEGTDIFERVQTYLKKFKPVKIPNLPPFSGGAVGFNGFEVIEEIEPSVKTNSNDDLGIPDAVFMVIDTLVAFDHVKNRIQLITHADLSCSNAADAYDLAVAKLNQMIERLKVKTESTVSFVPHDIEPLDYKSNTTKEEFFDMVTKAKRYIYDGDIIQVVLSQRFEADLDIDPLTVHRALRMVNPSPYMFCLQLDGMALVGASPEIHAKCQDGEMLICPIAGTRKRGTTPTLDKALEKELLSDEKELAEHIMLVDLARNDLGRIAAKGTVEVSDLMHIELYSHVMHIVSNVTAKLDDGLPSHKVMSATFPAGTLSGAPKIRAMQIIA